MGKKKKVPIHVWAITMKKKAEKYRKYRIVFYAFIIALFYSLNRKMKENVQIVVNSLSPIPMGITVAHVQKKFGIGVLTPQHSMPKSYTNKT